MLEPCLEVQESSSLNTAHQPLPPPPAGAVAALCTNSANSEVDDSASTTGNNNNNKQKQFSQRTRLSIQTPDFVTEFALSAMPQPLNSAMSSDPQSCAAENVTTPAVGAASHRISVYRGGYDKEEKAARAYDLAVLKYWGPSAITNFLEIFAAS